MKVKVKVWVYSLESSRYFSPDFTIIILFTLHNAECNTKCSEGDCNHYPKISNPNPKYRIMYMEINQIISLSYFTQRQIDKDKK